MLDLADIRSALSVQHVLSTYGVKARLTGSQYRLKECPRCRQVSPREPVVISAKTGSWLHHGHQRSAGGSCSGDVFDLIAALEGVDAHRSFRTILDKAAQLAGITTCTEHELHQRRQAQRDRARQERINATREHQHARTTADLKWSQLPRRSPDGESYLESRGLDATRLIQFDAVRFSNLGPVVAIRDQDGTPVSTATRLISPGQLPKVMALKGHPTRGTMIDYPGKLTTSAHVVIVEGVMDALTARLAWPGSLVLGANGAGNIPHIASAIAIDALRFKPRIILIAHHDEPGIRAVTAAVQILQSAGLDVDQIVDAPVLPHPDLNASWCQGWRP